LLFFAALHFPDVDAGSHLTAIITGGIPIKGVSTGLERVFFPAFYYLSF